MQRAVTKEDLICYHCGEKCTDESIRIADKLFCCFGCKTVFELLNENNLCEYYNYDNHPGVRRNESRRSDVFAVLDNAEVKNKLISFTDGKQTHVTFFLPVMHCSSCIWLLENLPRINPGIISSRVDFLKKEVLVIYNEQKISLREVANLLSSIGYDPHLNLEDLSGRPLKKVNHQQLYKIGIAGFCFGNIMMMSFPEYFSSGNLKELDLKKYFTLLNVLLSLPVFFYCASEFFTSAWDGLKQKFLNIDLPIALAIAITFVRSLYEILYAGGPGYLDSMSGIVFFMLVGRYFQNKTYDALTFERNYKSYFPIAVSVLVDGTEKQQPLSALEEGDRISIHNNEIIPADAILFSGKAFIDYSFVTGESLAVEKSIGEIIYAGGKHIGQRIDLEVVRKVSQSYLTGLWNHQIFNKQKQNDRKSFIHSVSRYFSIAVISASFLAGIYWMLTDPSKALNAITTPLIVACPCALLLAATFTNGTIVRIFGRNKFYLKNTGVIEALGKINIIVFDKTGTLTETGLQQANYEGEALNEYEMQLVRSLTFQSIHPLSRMIRDSFPLMQQLKLSDFSEDPGYGMFARVGNDEIRLGSAGFAGTTAFGDVASSKVYLSINGKSKGVFRVANNYRKGLNTMINNLSGKYKLAVLSGDHDGERKFLGNLFNHKELLFFNQKPEDKLNRIDAFRKDGQNVLMMGDGLNDAGALAASDVGVAVADHINNFSPACDAILEGSQLYHLDSFLKVAAGSKKVILFSFFISVIYNIGGLYFALQGNLAPVIAAILMPLSSISIVLFTTMSSNMIARVNGLK